MKNPFADLIGLSFVDVGDGRSECTVEATEVLFNPHGVLHGAVPYALADTGMGAAVYSTLEEGQICATIDIKINYFQAVRGGRLLCRSEIINRGRRIANLESRIWAGDALVAHANGNFAIFTPGTAPDGVKE